MDNTLVGSTAVAGAACAYAYAVGDDTVLCSAGAVGIALLAATLLSMGGKKVEKQEILLVDSKAKHSLKLLEREVRVLGGCSECAIFLREWWLWRNPTHVQRDAT